MRLRTLLLMIFLSFISQFCFSQVQWVWQNPLPQNNSLFNVNFVNQNTGYATGDAGYIIKTTNAGANWTILNTGSTAELRGLSFVDNNIIYASGDNNILKTTNAGVNWTVSVVNGIGYIDDIRFVNATTGFYRNNFIIYKSVNSGMNWSSIYSTSIQTSSFEFINAETGFVGSSGLSIRKTTNGGLSWTVVMSASGYENIRPIHFVNSTTGFAAGSMGTMLKSIDGGNNWTNLTPVTNGMGLMSFIDADNFIVAGRPSSGNSIYKTSNGGLNWINFSNNSANSIYNITYLPAGNIITVGDMGAIMKSTDGGNNWISETQGYFEDLYGIFFLDEQTGYAAGKAGRFLKTTDGGSNWNSISTGYSVNFSSIYFLNNYTGFISGKSSTLIKTTNSGINWIAVFPTGTENISNLFFIDNNNGYASAEHFMLKTADGGNTWIKKINPGGPSPVLSISFPNQTTGYITNGVRNFYKTTNSGDSWNLIFNYSNLNDIQFFNENTGYFISSNIIKKTTDGGSSWNVVNTFNLLGINLSQMKFINENTGFISGLTSPHSRSIGIVCKTTDAGKTWTYEYTGTVWGPLSLFPVNAGTCFISCLYGVIMKRTEEGITSANNNGNIIPEKFSLLQNFPNPFNPNTIIKYNIPSLGNGNSTISVKLVVYDMLGREVSTLVNDERKAGTYEINFDGSNLSSGMYFYKLTAGDPSLNSSQSFTETKKMVILK